MLPSFRSARTALTQTIVIACTITCSIQTVRADSWNYKADASASWAYNDNPTLQPEDSILRRNATSFGRLLARGIVEYQTARSYADVATRIASSYYPNEEDKDLESVDFYLLSNSNYAWQRSAVDLVIDYSNIGLLTSELTTGGSGSEPGGSPSGSLFRADDRSQRYRLAPGYSYQLSPKDRLQIGLDYSGIDFELEKTNRADNENKSLRLSYRRSVNERLQIGFTASGRRFRAEKLAPIPDFDIDLINRSESIGLTMDMSYQWGESTNILLNVGRTNTTSEQTALLPNISGTPQTSVSESDIKNTNYSLSLNHTGRRNQYSISISQGIVPSSLGVENNQITLSASLQRKLRENLTGKILVNGFNQKASINNSVSRFNNTFRLISANATITWQFRRNWGISGLYTYRQSAQDGGNDTSRRGQSNQLGATLTYRWD